jgi:hypothetical protein
MLPTENFYLNEIRETASSNEVNANDTFNDSAIFDLKNDLDSARKLPNSSD